MRKLTNVFFKPWVGENYEDGIFEGKKMLILGESHYCGGCEKCGIKYGNSCEKFSTTQIINSYRDYNSGQTKAASYHSTFTKFANVIHNRKINSDEMEKFWQSVMFYNYVQVSISQARKSPTEEEFSLSEEAFYEVLNEYKPDLVIIWGERLLNNMPSKNGKWSDRKVCDLASENVYIYDISGKMIPCYCVYHPSSSKYNYGYAPYLESFIKEW